MNITKSYELFFRRVNTREVEFKWRKKMTREEVEKLNDAIKTLKNFCKDKECDNCKLGVNCSLISFDDWQEIELPKEKSYRPFNSNRELLSRFENPNRPKDTMPLIWVKEKVSGNIYLICGFLSEDGLDEELDYVQVGKVNIGLSVLFENYTFLNGEPCGVEE